MSIVKNFKPAAKALPYADDIKELAEGDENDAFALVTKGVQDPESGAWEYPTTELTKFQNAARAADRSARVVQTDIDEAKHVATRYIQLGARRTRTVKGATVDAEAS